MKSQFARLLFLLAACTVAAPVAAQAPAMLPVQGFLTELDGTPRDGEFAVEIRLFDAAVDGVELHFESQTVDVDTGYFTTEVGLAETLDMGLFGDFSDVWLELVVDGETLEPRLRLGSVPFAAFADLAGDARTLGGATLEDLLAPIDWSDLTGIPADIADGDDNGPFNWADLVGIPSDIADGDQVGDAIDFDDVQARVLGACAPGSSIRSIAADGTVLCEDDTDTTYRAGSGLSLAGTTFAVDSAAVQARVAGTCDPGSSIRAIASDGTVICEDDTDTDTNTTYTAGAGLSLAGTTFAVAADSVTPAMQSYGSGLALPFFPNVPTPFCDATTVGGNVFGSTSSTTDQYIANLYYNEEGGTLSMQADFTRARLQVSCRGEGVFELVDGCSDILATIECTPGVRPWTATSAEFNPSSAPWNLRVRATSGTVEWANPQVILY